MVRNGHGQSGLGTLKLSVSQEKCYFNDSRVGMVKKGCGHSAHEILKSTV